MKTVHVVAALIVDDLVQKRELFATARGYGEWKGFWEFPGGKVEPGESPEQALVREIQEELNVEIRVGERLHTVEYDYANFHLSMDCFWAQICAGEPELKEAEAACWLRKNTLETVEWLPADESLLPLLRQHLC